MKKLFLALLLVAISVSAASAELSITPYQANPRFIQRKYVIIEEEKPHLKRPMQAAVITAFIPNDSYYSTKGHLYSAYPLLDDLWGVKLMNMESAWDFTKGSGVIVAVVDSGVAMTHAELQGNIWFNALEQNGVPGVDDDGNGFIDDINGWDFVGGDSDPTDLAGHGTHVAGIIGALGGNNKGIIGIAPQSKIMPVRVLDDTGSGFWFNVALGVRYAADNGAQVINLSLGQQASLMLPFDITLIQSAIQYAKGKGAIVVVAAGNDGINISNFVPARFSEAIAVGALRHEYDTFSGSGGLSYASFSNFGTQLDFMAPGVDILSLAPSSTVYAGYAVFNDGTSYYSAADGTSMAAPMVSGLVALMLSLDPLSTFDDIYRRLRYSSIDMGASGFDNFYGYGRVDALEALTHDYYSDGVVKTLKLLVADAAGIIRYDYFHSGHVDTALAQNGNVYKFYDASQRLKSLKDAAGNILDYYDDAFGSSGQGRFSKVTLTSGAEYRMLEYWGDTAVYKKLAYYQSGALVYTNTYYQSGVLESITYADGSINVLYEDTQRLKSITNAQGNIIEYSNDAFGPGGSGRYSKITLTDGAEYRFTEYWGDTSTYKSVDYYQSGVFVATFHFDVNGNPTGSEINSKKEASAAVIPAELTGKQTMLGELATQKKGLSGEGMVTNQESLSAR